MDDPGTRLWRRESLSEVAGPFFFFYFYHCHPGYDDMTTYALDALNDGFPTNDIHTKHLMLPTRQPVHSIRWVEMYFFSNYDSARDCEHHRYEDHRHGISMLSGPDAPCPLRNDKEPEAKGPRHRTWRKVTGLRELQPYGALV